MKRSFLIFAAVAVAVFGALGAILVFADPAPAASSLSATEVTDLQHMREEEKLARDVYSHLDTLYGDQVFVFANITASESRHTLAVRDLLTRYGVWDPAGIDVPGVFWNEELQDLYDLLVSKGDDSLTDALEVGVTIEVLDIHDLTECLEHTSHKDITTVYTHLRDASYSHLEAFEKALAK